MQDDRYHAGGHQNKEPSIQRGEKTKPGVRGETVIFDKGQRANGRFYFDLPLTRKAEGSAQGDSDQFHLDLNN